MSVAAGEPAAFEKLYECLKNFLYFFRKRVGEDADDLYHELIVALISQLRDGALREPDRLMGYARTIASRLVAQRITSYVEARQQSAADDYAHSIRADGPNPEACAIRQEQSNIASRILRALPVRDREVLIRFYINEHEAERIQTDMHLTETQFRLIKSRAKQRFHALCDARLKIRQRGAVAGVADTSAVDPSRVYSHLVRKPIRLDSAARNEHLVGVA